MACKYGMLPEEMQKSRLYGMELDSLTGRLAKQLYPEADIQNKGFEETNFPNDFFDVAVGNVPFGQYKVADKEYDKRNLMIHDYFFAKTLDKVRPGGIVAFVTSKGTMDELGAEAEERVLPADPSVRNFSYTVVDNEVYYRENSVMNPVDVPEAKAERIKGMVAIRDCTRKLIDMQMDEVSPQEIAAQQKKLNDLYDAFEKKHGRINSRTNKSAFNQDSSYSLLCSLEKFDSEGNFKEKADMFTKRTIKRAEVVTSVDTASEALAVSLSEKARVDLPYMAGLAGKSEQEITDDLAGVIFKEPVSEKWQTADEYLSGNVREKLAVAEKIAESDTSYAINVEALKRVMPLDLDASEIEVRIGATWIEPKYIDQFMKETLQTPDYLIWNSQDGLSKVGQIIDAFPDAKVYGELPGLIIKDRPEVDLDTVKQVYVDEAAKLAAEIDRFSSDFDPHEYKDTVENWELQVQNIADDIRKGNATEYKDYLGTVIAESDNIEDVRKAAELLVKLAEYKPLAKVEELEEVNLNQIDNVLSNTVPKAEEKKEARQAEQERLEELQRIEEKERKRRARGERPSLRARLAMKKAIVAANSAVPQRSKQREAQEAAASQRDI